VLYSEGKNGKKNGEPVVPVPQLEPAFYWRIQRDYRDYLVETEGVSMAHAQARAKSAVPAPRIVVVSDKATTVQVEEALNAPEVRQYPRLVLLVLATQQQTDRAREEEEARAWAEHSVGKFGRFEEESGHYGALAGLQSVQQREKGSSSSTSSSLRGGRHVYMPGELVGVSSSELVANTLLCANILGQMKGNRSCFDKCN